MEGWRGSRGGEGVWRSKGGGVEREYGVEGWRGSKRLEGGTEGRD